MGAGFHIHTKTLKIKGTFVKKLRVLYQISSKSVGAKLVFLKNCWCSCTHCTHTNEGPALACELYEPGADIQLGNFQFIFLATWSSKAIEMVHQARAYMLHTHCRQGVLAILGKGVTKSFDDKLIASPWENKLESLILINQQHMAWVYISWAKINGFWMNSIPMHSGTKLTFWHWFDSP